MAKEHIIPARFDEQLHTLVIEFAEEKNWTNSVTIYEIVKSFFADKLKNAA
jgi:hypothetical protein